MAIPLFVLENERRRVYRERKLLNNLSAFEVEQHTGFPVWGVKELLRVFESVEGHTANATPLETRVLSFLSYLRSGSFQWCIGSLAGTSQPTTSRILHSCLNLTADLASTVIQFPTTVQEINTSKLGFHRIAKFNNVLGLIDGTQIAIKAPKEDEAVFVCRKQYHSINTQIICGPDYSIYDIVASWPGSTHDSFIYNNCSAKQRITTGEFGEGYLLGDSGYPLEERLLTPYSVESSECHTIYNCKHKVTRSLVERVIGNLKSRFRCIDKTGGALCYAEGKACKIIVSAAVLHNLCVKKLIPLLQTDEAFRDNYVIPNHQEESTSTDIVPAQPQTSTHRSSNTRTRSSRVAASALRDSIATAFERTSSRSRSNTV